MATCGPDNYLVADNSSVYADISAGDICTVDNTTTTATLSWNYGSGTADGTSLTVQSYDDTYNDMNLVWTDTPRYVEKIKKKFDNFIDELRDSVDERLEHVLEGAT